MYVFTFLFSTYPYNLIWITGKVDYIMIILNFWEISVLLAFFQKLNIVHNSICSKKYNICWDMMVENIWIVPGITKLQTKKLLW